MNFMTTIEWTSPTPTIMDGVTREEEINIMFEVRSVLLDIISQQQHYSHMIAYKAMFIFHKYLTKSSVKKLKWDQFVVATGCLLLASKIDDRPLKLRSLSCSLANIMHKMGKTTEKPSEEVVLKKFDRKICYCEIDILHEIGFDLEIHLPYGHLKTFKKFPAADISKILDVAQVFCNDSFLYPLCLYYHPAEIACCCIYWSTLFLKIKLPLYGSAPWYKFIHPKIEMDQILKISEYFRKIYYKIERDILSKKQAKQQQQKGSNSSPALAYRDFDK